MTERQTKALNNLYAATIEVLEAFAPETVSADQRREALSRMIENFLISASSPDAGIVMPQMPIPATSVSHEPIRQSAASVSGSDPAYNSAPISNEETPRPSVSTSAESVPSFEVKEIRFANIPVLEDGSIPLFKRLKAEEGKDPDEYYPYILNLGDEEGIFSVAADFMTFPAEKVSDERFHESAVVFVPDRSMPDGSRGIRTIESGRIKKYGKKSWQIIQPAKVKYE